MPDSPPRHFDLAGASNFRDLGGYPAKHGRMVRWRQLFRSNHLGHVTAADIAVLRALGLKNAFDFRGTEERAAAICGLTEIAVHSLPIEPTVVAALRARLAAGAVLSSADALEVMRDSYRNYVRHNTPSFRTLFAHLLEDRAPLVIHCTAGKDRTGFACALILHALGVPDETITQDYLLTNRFYRRDPSASSDLPEDVRQALDTIRDDYGDLENYLSSGLGVGTQQRDKLQARYLDS
jgi:protein-tyrosine phosphatase